MRLLRIGFDLLAKLTDLDSQILYVDICSPQISRSNEFMCKDPSGMFDEHPQDLIFAW